MAIIRADAGPIIGGGHISRMQALKAALAAENFRVDLAFSQETARFFPALQGIVLKDEVSELKKLEKPDILVIDHYQRGLDFELALKDWAKTIMAVDDLPNRAHDVDILLDQTYGRAKEEYHPCLKSPAKLLLGPEYALLRPDFAALRAEIKPRHKLQRIMIAMGAADHLNATALALKALDGMGLEIDVVLSPNAIHIQEVKSLAKSLDAKLHINCDGQEMAKIMAAADLAIGSCGVTSWERCVLGLPALMLTIADNQKDIARNLDKAKAGVHLGFAKDIKPEDIKAKLDLLRENPHLLEEMSKKALGICDGNGARKTARIVKEIVEKKR